MTQEKQVPRNAGKVAIIGAGPAGLTAAYQLTKAGVPCEVFEASSSVGGMARTIPLWNQKVDLGPHRFFSSDSRVNNLWKEIVGPDHSIVDRLTRIYYKQRFFYYPLRPINALFNLGLKEALRCCISYLRQLISPEPFAHSSFESWVVSRFGRRLFEIFFKSYSEKLWGIPCSELDADFAAQRIKKLSLLEAIKSAFLGNQGNQHKTLVDQFSYPHEGSGIVYERMAKFVNARGGSVALNTPIQKIIVQDGKVTGLQFSSGEVRSYDHVISTMPLTQMVKGLGDAPNDVLKAADSLVFRNTILVYLNVEGTQHFPDNWIYVHAPNLRTGRITNFRNWVPQLYGNSETSILALEYWCYYQDPIWNETDAELIERAKLEIQSTGLIGNSRIIDGYVWKIPKCYPVYRSGYKSHVNCIVNYLTKIQNLTVIGRYGSFKYNNQDHSILMGILAAENICHGKSHNLWDVNTDYETYQESAAVAESGA